jgi:hypothetical protein
MNEQLLGGDTLEVFQPHASPKQAWDPSDVSSPNVALHIYVLVRRDRQSENLEQVM